MASSTSLPEANPSKKEGQGAPLHGGLVVGGILKEHGVKHVFGIPATYVWPLENGFQAHGITSIQMRWQTGAAYAADAYARCGRSPGVCFGSSGIGVTDSVSGINQAFLAKSPVIGLFGMHEWEESGRGAIQEVYPSRIFDSMTKWCVDIDDRNLIPLHLRRALRDCMVYPPGPVVLGMSMRALGRVKNPKALRGNLPLAHMAVPQPAQGHPEAVSRAACMLEQAQRPVIAAGDGVYWAGAWAELSELAQQLEIPVNMRRMARGSLAEDHRLAVGGAFRADFWTEADLILVVGLQLGSFERGGRPPAWPAHAKRILIHEAADEGWSPLPAAECIVGSPRLVLRQLLDALGSARPKSSRKPWLDHLEASRDAYEKGLYQDERQYAERVPIHPWIVSREVAAFLDPGATLILDSFLVSTYLTDRVKASFPGQILDSGEAGGFGYGIGMGIGAQLARPGRQVVVLTSDTSLGMGGGDLETALRCKLPVVYVVCNHGSLAGGVDGFFRGQAPSWNYLPGLRYDRMYEALGCHGEFVERPEQLKGALHRAFDAGKPAVVNVLVDNRVVHPWFESLSFRLGVIVHQLDPEMIPEPFHSYLWDGRTPEVEAALEKAGVPRSKTSYRVMAFDRSTCASWTDEKKEAS